MDESSTPLRSDGFSRRRVLVAGGSSLTTVLAGCSGSSNGDDSTDTGGSVASVPLPPSPSEYRYAVMGTGDADLTVTYFGSWKCPYCAQFSSGFLGQLAEDYVGPGKIAIEFRNMAYINGQPFLGPDAPAAGRAGLAVWNNDPPSYWAYHEHVLQNQPPEDEQWATADELVSFAEAAGVSDPSVIRTAIDQQKYGDPLHATGDAAAEAGVEGAPTLVIDGTTINPLGNEKQTRQLIQDALE